MLHEVADEVDAADPAALRTAYAARLEAAVGTVGVERAVDAAGLDRETAAALAAGEPADGVTVREAAALLAAANTETDAGADGDTDADGADGTRSPDTDADAIVAELRDQLLLGMTTAVLDVDTLAGAIDADLTGQEVQQALEGRTPMTLGQLAQIQAVISERS